MLLAWQDHYTDEMHAVEQIDLTAGAEALIRRGYKVMIKEEATERKYEVFEEDHLSLGEGGEGGDQDGEGNGKEGAAAEGAAAGDAAAEGATAGDAAAEGAATESDNSLGRGRSRGRGSGRGARVGGGSSGRGGRVGGGNGRKGGGGKVGGGKGGDGKGSGGEGGGGKGGGGKGGGGNACSGSTARKRSREEKGAELEKLRGANGVDRPRAPLPLPLLPTHPTRRRRATKPPQGNEDAVLSDGGPPTSPDVPVSDDEHTLADEGGDAMDENGNAMDEDTDARDEKPHAKKRKHKAADDAPEVCACPRHTAALVTHDL